jgi:tRNA dimethylallyltransferase
LRIDAAREWLAARIDARFDVMLGAGAWEEVRAMAPDWDPTRPAAKAIGARELMAALQGRMSESEAIAAAKAASRRYAKRQRTWLRRRMADWNAIDPGGLKATLSFVPAGSR